MDRRCNRLPLRLESLERRELGSFSPGASRASRASRTASRIRSACVTQPASGP